MKKIISLLLSFMMLFSFSTAFALNSNAPQDNTTDDIFIDENGEVFHISRIVTNKYSRSIVKNSSNEIVNDFTYEFISNTLKSNTTGEIIDSIDSIDSVNTRSITTYNDYMPDGGSSGKYKYRYTNTFNFKFTDYTQVAIVAAIMAIKPGPTTAVIGAVVTKAITEGLAYITCKQAIYSYTEGGYYYQKATASIFRPNNTIIGGPWSTYTTVKEK